MLKLAAQDGFKLEFYKGPETLNHWDRALPSIKKALDRGSNYTLTDIFYGLSRAEMQLWLYGSDALVTALQINKSGKKHCLLLACGGDRMSDWLQYLSYVEDWARDEGCQEIRIYGRVGWSKKLGYAIDYAKMSKQL